ncbi:MAG: PAS domain S-box protein [Burkholderiaceae bacterium]
MNQRQTDVATLRAENAELRVRLDEAEETLTAIRTGQVDALVVGDDVYTLASADAASRRLHTDVLAQMEDAVVARDRADHVIYLNPAAERRYGMTASQALGRHWHELCAERWAADGDEGAARATLLDTGACQTRSLHAPCAGAPFDAETSISRLTGASGETIGCLAVIRDVSERKRAETSLLAAGRELAQRERHFVTLIENLPDIVSRFDVDHRHVYMHPQVEALTGLTADGFIGRTNAELGVAPDLCKRWDEALEGAFRSHRPVRFEYDVQTLFDGVRHYETRLIPEFGADGRVESVLGISTDSTERERTAAALRESRARLQFTLDSAGVGDWDLDLTTHTARRSLRHDQCFGYSEPAPDWTLEIFLSHVHPDDRARVRELFETAMTSLTNWDFQCRVIWSDASVHWIEAHGAIYHTDGKPTRMLGIVIDATERVAAETALRDADRRKDEFLATLAHELRNPLAPIGGALKVISLSNDAHQQRNARDVIDRQMRQMVHLIDDLMDVSRITQGKVMLRRESVDLTGAVHQALEAVRPLLETLEHDLTLSLPPSGTIAVDADPTRLVQIIANLLNNAAKYTPAGGTVSVTTDLDGSFATVAVQDSGPGIHAGMLPRIFDMFAQDPATTGRAQGGLGIGLALVRKFTELHGGSVEAHSGGDVAGTRIVIRWPLFEGDAVSAPPPRTSAPRPTASAAFKVLVVDDNVDSAQTLATLIELMGCETRTAHDGVQAVQAADAFRPDLMLLDIGLPHLDGHGVAREVRSRAWGRDVVLIALSGWSQESDRRKSAEAGFDQHLVKPLDLELLDRLLDQHMTIAGRSAAHGAGA